MKWRSPIWLLGTATLLLAGLIVNQIFWVYNSAGQQEEQFNAQIQMALASIENQIKNDTEMCYSVDCCLVQDKNQVCSSSLNGESVWTRTDSMISSELQRFDIDLNYNFDFCFEKPGQEEDQAYIQNMDKVFDDSGIILYLEFPDRTKYLRNQIGPVFITSILFIVFLSFVFVMTYRFYKKERNFSQRTRDFINNMTHEFNTPIANISLANSMIAKGIENQTKEKLLHYSNIIEEENVRLAKNCEDLLQIAKFDNLEMEFADSIDVHEVIHKIVEATKSMNLEEGVTFNCDLGADKYLVLGKESLLYNSISNLVDNAIKYSKEAAQISINTSSNGTMLRVEVVDNGIGIKNHHLPNLFDKFYRVSEGDEHNVKGFGLGLAYVKMVISKMDGEVKVESDFGGGSTFAITLPIND